MATYHIPERVMAVEGIAMDDDQLRDGEAMRQEPVRQHGRPEFTVVCRIASSKMLLGAPVASPRMLLAKTHATIVP